MINIFVSSWWRREYQGEYLPVLSLNDSYLMDYVKKTGLYVVNITEIVVASF